MRGPGTGGISGVVTVVAGKVAVGSTTGLGTFAGSFLSILEAERRWSGTGGTYEGRAGPTVPCKSNV